MLDNATKHAMARRLQELLGIAQAESILAGIKLQAGQQVGHPALAALHADERMWDAVVKALTPQQQPQQGSPATAASPHQKPPAKPVATLEDIRATLVAQGQPSLAGMLADGSNAARLVDVAETIEATSWESGAKAATMANVAVLLREMAKGKTEANLRSPATARPRPWCFARSSGRLEFGGSSRNV